MTTINNIKNILHTCIPTTFLSYDLIENNQNFINTFIYSSEEENYDQLMNNMREILSLFSYLLKYHKNISWDIRTIITEDNKKYISIIENKNNTITIHDFKIFLSENNFIIKILNNRSSSFIHSYHSINGITNYNQFTNILLDYFNSQAVY